jgi:GAF domain-containing protein
VVDVEVPMVLPDARLYPRVRRNLAIEDLGVVAYAGMPLTDLDGRVLGSLCAIDSKPRAWTAEQLRTRADLAAACSSELRLRIAVQGAEQARRRAEEAHDRLAMLAGMSETLGGTLDVATAIDRLGQAMVPLLADWCLITLVDPAGRPRTVAGTHRDPQRKSDVARFAEVLATGLGPDSIIRSVVRSGRPVMRGAASLDDVARGTTSPELVPLAALLGFGSHLSVPITAAGDRIIGTVTLVNGPARRGFDESDLRTLRDLGRRAGQAVGNSRLYSEQRHVAEVLQQSMLPTLPEVPGVELAARYLPAADRVEVGGDWYDAFVQPDGDLVAAIGDVAGHDIEAAATMGQLRNLVRGDAYGRDDPVDELMTHLDRAIQGLPVPTVASAVLARVRPAAPGLRLSWCNAGHPPPLLIPAEGPVQVLDGTRGALLGLARTPRRTRRELTLAAGDTLLLHTDGLIERRDRPIDEGQAELIEQLAGTAPLPLAALCDRLLAAAPRREDDIALLALRAR